MHSILYPVVAGVVLALYLQFLSYQRKSKARSLGCEEPLWMEWGPFGWRNITALFKADQANRLPQWFVDRHYRLVQEFGRTIGTFRYSLGGTEHIHTSDPKNIQAMLTTQFGDFEQGWIKRSIIEPFTGPNGIFSQDGKDWEHSRIMLRPSFTRDQVGDMKRLEKHVQLLMSALRPSETRKGWSSDVDFKDLFFRLTLDSSTEMLFGESVYSQTLSLPEHIRPDEFRSSLNVDPVAFAKAFDVGQHCGAVRARLSRLGQFYITSEAKRCAKIASDFADPYVQLALDRTANEKTDDQKPRYIFAEAIAKETRDPEIIKQQLLSIMIAGRDTTASLLSYFFRHLVRKPEVFTRLRGEIISTFGTYSHPEEITFASLKGCSYLQNCISETLRMNTTIPINTRIATRDTTLPSGGGPDGSNPIFVPKGRVIDFSTHVMHLRKDLWGPDADEFKPERFQGRRHQWDFLPFAAGPRICLGQQMATITASYVIVRLLQRYEEIEGTEEEMAAGMGDRLGLSSAPDHGPLVRMREAEA